MQPDRDSTSNPQPADATAKRRPGIFVRTARIAALTLGGLVLLIIALTAGATWWLNPDRLTRIFNERTSQYLDADVRAGNVNFTLWSTFPHFRVRVDSLQVVSRALHGVPESVRDSLPAGADSLLSLRSLEGGINVMSLMAGQISLGDVDVDGLRVNAVAVSDSAANYLILPDDMPSAKRVPRITAKSISLTNPQPITYYSAATSTQINARLGGVELRRVEHARTADAYGLKIDGRLTANVGDLRVLNDFPFSLNGDVALGFRPFKLSLESYKINLNDITTEISANVSFDDNVEVHSLHSEVKPFRIRNLIACLPEPYRPDISNLRTDLTAHASVRLTAPFVFSADSLPSFDVSFSVPEGTVDYTTSDGQTLALRETGLLALLHFTGTDPAASTFELQPMRVWGDGMDCTVSAEASDLLGDVSVSGALNGNVDLKRLASIFPVLKSFELNGTASTSASASMRLGSLSNPQPHDADARATLRIPRLTFAAAKSGVSANIDSLRLTATTDPGLSGLDLTTTLSRAGVDASDTHTDARGITLSAHLPAKWRSLPATLRLAARDASLRTAKSDYTTTVADAILTASAPIGSLTSGDPLAKLQSALSARHICITDAVQTTSIDGMKASVAAAARAKAIASPDAYRLPPDTVSTGPHTPQWLAIALPPAGRRLVASHSLRTAVSADSASYFTPTYPMPMRATGFDLEATTDSVSLRPLTLRCGVSALAIAGSASNLERLLLLGGTEPLRLRFELNADTLNLNQLAHLYETGATNTLLASRSGLTRSQADSIVRNPARTATLSGSDTTTLLLPRNIMASMKVRAKAADYTNLHFFDIGTAVDMADGNLNVDSLYLSSYFGKAFASFSLRTADPLQYGASVYFNIVEIDLDRFYQRFNKLVEMWPQMTNLSGFISAGVTLGVEAFPNMSLNIPSLWARLDAEGYRLRLHQDHFIRRITRMMLIGTDKDIRIPTIRLHANIHSNLVEVDPFTIVFDRYKLRTTGMNDFDGNLYYHVGVEKSPIPFRYAINVVGDYDHPKIRLGRFDYKPDQAMRLNSIVKNSRVNLVKEAKYYLMKLVRHASEADTIPSAN